MLGVLHGRAVLVEGLDVGADDFDFDPAGMDDLQLRDAVIVELLREFDDHGNGRCSTVALVTAAGRPWIVSGHEGGVVLLDDGLRQVGDAYDGHDGEAVDLVAVTGADGDLVIASVGDANSVHIRRATLPG
ncbi:hypothetical protein [Micromonospora aurantiaca (nom. illeg.)]|uniref:hypothetical protein n=1 Tax=Micromonospora aurantiaca (nom. illeg.) TaxID=47850 RepID=UPI003F49D51C